MSATVVNDRKNLPVTIKVAKISSLEKRGVKKEFLFDLLANEQNGVGVIRDGYMMVSTNALIIRPKDSQSLRSFAKIRQKLNDRFFDLLMIKF